MNGSVRLSGHDRRGRQPAGSPGLSPGPSASWPARILIVEDAFLEALQLDGELRAAGYTVVGSCNELSAALTAVRRGGFDLAILDVNLAGELVYPLADELAARGVPFILLSGYLKGDLPERFREVPRLNKPHDPRALLRSIRQVLPERA
jgi:DNA-binding response OmpR family regulator